MALNKITFEIADDLFLDLRQFCFENRMSYSDALSEILYGFFDDTTLSIEYESSEEYQEEYLDKYGHKKKKNSY